MMDHELKWESMIEVSVGDERRRERLLLPILLKSESRRVSVRILSKTSKGSVVLYFGAFSSVVELASRRAASLGS